MLHIQPLKVFISYSHEDEDLKEELEVHLATLVRRGKIASWRDRTLEAGIEWAPQIQLALQTADIVLLLVSPHFMASDYINDVELKAALEKHRSGTARVIPIVLKHVDWYGTDIAALASLPKDGKPITTWSDKDEAFKDVVQGLRKVVETLQASKHGRGRTGPTNPIPPISNSHFYQRHRFFDTQPNGGKALPSHSDFPSRTGKVQRSGSHYTSRSRSNPLQRSRSYISEIVKVVRGGWYYFLPLLILWVVIGVYQQEVGDLSGKREMLGFLCLGALGGFLTGIVTSLAWQNFSQSRFQVDALLLWSLLGLIVGGLLWILVYFLFGTRFILTQGTRIGFSLGLTVVFILLWKIKAQMAKDTHW